MGCFQLTTAPVMKFPLNFQTAADHINFLGLLSAINIGSGYRELLHQYCNKGAFDTIAYGCMGMYMTAR